MPALALPRQCGDSRDAGGVYVEPAYSDKGKPPEFFLACPPEVISLPNLKAKKRGVTLIERDGIHYILDFVGESYYPNWLDIWKEGVYAGFSRRCEGIDFAKLTKGTNVKLGSRLLLAHGRVSNRKVGDYLARMDDEELGFFKCPKAHEHHSSDEFIRQYLENPNLRLESCLGFCWHDVREGINWPEHVKNSKEGQRLKQERALKCGAVYEAYPRPYDITPEYDEAAIFASFPIGRIVIVNDPQGKTHVDKYEEVAPAQDAGINVEIVEE